MLYYLITKFKIICLQVLIIARYSGAVSVCSTSDLHNMLGESPEFFAGQPQVSAASGDGRGFLSLECEVNVTSKRPRLDDSADEQADEVSSLIIILLLYVKYIFLYLL